MSTAHSERAQAATLPEDDVIGILLHQHARVRELFADVKSTRGEQRKAKFDELRGLLAVHETAEEMILRPVAKKTAGAEESEARNHEEQEANQVLSELEKLDVDGERFDSLLGEFEGSVADHANSEEREEFPAIRRECSEDQLTSMGKRLLAAEKAAPTHPHPGAAGSPAAQWTAGPFASMVDRVKDAINKGG